MGEKMRKSRTLKPTNRWAVVLLSTLAATAVWCRPVGALTIDGTLADKNSFLAYLINQGASGNLSAFVYGGPNANQNGPADLIGDSRFATNNFGNRMATAAGDVFNGLTVHVGRNIPRIIFGAFRWDPTEGGRSREAHQTIDLADMFALPIRSPELTGGTDWILHEVFEGIVGLGGGMFRDAHFSGGYTEENSNRAADGNRGLRVFPPPMNDRLVVNEMTGDWEAQTAWRINDPIRPRDGNLIMRGRIIGDGNFTVTNIQFGALAVGSMSDDGTRFDIQVSDVFFEPVPEPSTYLLLATGLVSLLGYSWRRQKQVR